MDTVDLIMSYLSETYHPHAVIIYGSYADGSAGEHSDFDALVIADCAKTHDAARIGGTTLDVFVYPPEAFRSDYDPEEFIQVYDGKIVADRGGIAEQLQKRVRDYVAQAPLKTDEEVRQSVEWCGKMLARASRGDPEGYFRWHWLLTDSLEIYCDIVRRHWFGPKKTLRFMAQADPEAFRICSLALCELDPERLSDWVACLRRLFADREAGGRRP